MSLGPPFKIGALEGDLHHLPLFVAIEKGYFKDEGINIDDVDDVNWFSNGNEVMVAFEADEIDVSYLGLAPAMSHKLTQEAPIKVISGVNVDGSAIVVSQTSGIDTLSDLNGKRIAVPSLNNMQDFILQIALDSVGLSHNDLKDGVPTVMCVGNMELALENDDIDGFIAWEPFNAKAVHSTSVNAKYLNYSSEIWPNHPCCVIAAHTDFISVHSDYLDIIVKVHKRALKWMDDPENYEELRDIAKKYTNIESDTIIDAAIANVGYIYDYTDSMSEIERFYDKLTTLNDNVPVWDDGRTKFFNEFLDSGFLDA